MREFEINLFTKALSCAQEERFIEAIEGFRELIDTCPESDLADDACYNIGLSYILMNQPVKALKFFQKVLDEYPDGTISVLGAEDEYGLTASKTRYAMMNCLCSLNKVPNAKEIYAELKQDQDSYIIKFEKKITFASLGHNLLFRIENESVIK